MGGVFVALFVVVVALDGADLDVVGRLRIAHAERECSLQTPFARVPFDKVVNLYPVPGSARAESHGLNETRAFTRPRDFDGHSGRPTLGDAKLGRSFHKAPRRLLAILPIHVPRRPL